MTRRRGAARPALHFLLAGGLLFGALRALPAHRAAPAVGPARGDDALLLEEALALRLDDSPTVRARLVELAQTLDLAGPDPAARERAARRLGLERSDPVLQRHMIELVRLAASFARRPPDEAALREYYAAHAQRCATPERVRLTQIYLSSARRGAAASADAEALLARLRSAALDADAAAELGDSFGRAGARLGASSHDALARTFGAAFAAAVFAQPVGEWRGPIASSYGLHLVRVEAHLPAEVPELDRVRSRVLHAYLRERGAGQLRDTLAALRAP